VITIFHLLTKGNKLKLPEVWRPDKVGRTNDLNYYLFRKMVHHPTSRCFILKDKIQVLVDAGIMTLNQNKRRSPPTWWPSILIISQKWLSNMD